MHPIEHMRYLARTTGEDPGIIASESAAALGRVARVEPVGLLPACRRLIARHLTTGPVWWVSARMLAAPDPAAEARSLVDQLDDDPTPGQLAGALPDDSTVLVIGWPELAAPALRRRGDVEVLAIDAAGAGHALARRLEQEGNSAWPVPDAGVAAAAVNAGLVLVEAVAAGPSGVLASLPSHAAAAAACHAGVPVWALAGVGRVLPDRLWEVLLARFDATGLEPWDRDVELVPDSLLAGVVGPDGLVGATDGLSAATCEVAPELLRDAG